MYSTSSPNKYQSLYSAGIRFSHWIPVMQSECPNIPTLIWAYCFFSLSVDGDSLALICFVIPKVVERKVWRKKPPRTYFQRLRLNNPQIIRWGYAKLCTIGTTLSAILFAINKKNRGFLKLNDTASGRLVISNDVCSTSWSEARTT